MHDNENEFMTLPHGLHLTWLRDKEQSNAITSHDEIFAHYTDTWGAVFPIEFRARRTTGPGLVHSDALVGLTGHITPARLSAQRPRRCDYTCRFCADTQSLGWLGMHVRWQLIYSAELLKLAWHGAKTRGSFKSAPAGIRHGSHFRPFLSYVSCFDQAKARNSDNICSSFRIVAVYSPHRREVTLYVTWPSHYNSRR